MAPSEQWSLKKTIFLQTDFPKIIYQDPLLKIAKEGKQSLQHKYYWNKREWCGFAGRKIEDLMQ